MRNLKKKGFTIVELVIVIAVIAVLAAVLIPTFVNLTKKANVSNDTTLVKNLNTALAADAEEHATMTDALNAAKDFGYDIAKIQAKAEGNKILWDSKNDCFVYLDSEKEKIVYIPDTKSVDVEDKDLWVISNEVDANYSTYLYGYEGTSVTAKYGLDVGECAITSVTYTEQTAGTVAVRTTAGTLTLNAPNATVNHYGGADEVYVNDVAAATYNIFGVVSFIQVAEGEHVVLKAGSSVSGLFVSGDKSCVEVENGQENVVKSDADGVTADSVKDSATKFGGGSGTEQDPYIIRNVEHMLNITSNYDSYCYYKVADGVKNLDLSKYGVVNLNGSFDGNNVKIVNLTTALFKNVGCENQKQNIKISNMDITVNIIDDNSLVRKIYNTGTTIFENIQLHGYIEGTANMGSFYKYGPNVSYTAEFKNCVSNATLVCTTANAIGGMLGHGLEGSNGEFNLIMDEKSGFTGKMYNVGGTTCYEIMGMCSHHTYILNGETVSRYEPTYKAESLNVVKPIETESGYTVAWQSGATKIIVTVFSQLTAYDSEGEKIQDKSGITWNLGSFEITDLEVTKVLDLVEKVEIINDKNHDLGYNFKGGTLTIYTARDDNYCEGNITIIVKQVGGNGNIVAIGNETIYSIVK